MHVVMLNYHYDAGLASAEELLERYSTLTGWAKALREVGAEVTVLQRFHEDITLRLNGVTYVLLRDRYGPRLRFWQIPRQLHLAVKRAHESSETPIGPTVVHINGLIFPAPVRFLRAMLPRNVALAAQHHAERPWKVPRSLIQRWGLQAIDGFLFVARELAKPWVEQGIIRSGQEIYQIMEGSTKFRRQDRAAARALTGMHGEPVVLWVGRLIPLKDPLTVLSGFEKVLQKAPSARLYMAYGSDDFLPQVRARVAASCTLAKAVTLLGCVPHRQLEPYYNSADYFVLGSHYEGSGYALAEALACGVVPVVTEIPAFRMMTDGGTIGGGWPPGNAEAFAATLLDVMRRPLNLMADRAAQFFEAHLSYPAIACEALKIYQDLAARRAGPVR